MHINWVMIFVWLKLWRGGRGVENKIKTKYPRSLIFNDPLESSPQKQKVPTHPKSKARAKNFSVKIGEYIKHNTYKNFCRATTHLVLGLERYIREVQHHFNPIVVKRHAHNVRQLIIRFHATQQSAEFDRVFIILGDGLYIQKNSKCERERESCYADTHFSTVCYVFGMSLRPCTCFQSSRTLLKLETHRPMDQLINNFGQ